MEWIFAWRKKMTQQLLAVQKALVIGIKLTMAAADILVDDVFGTGIFY